MWLFLAALVLVLALTLDQFWSPGNLVNVARQVSIIGIIAVGVTVVLLAGHFDLSVGAIATLAAVLAIAMQPVDAAGTIAALALPLLAGLVAGACNGALVGWLGANSIVATVGMQLVVSGLTLLLVAGQHVRVEGATATFMAIGNGQLLQIPVPVWMLMAIAVLTHLLMTRTLFGRHVAALGSSPVAARMIAVPVEMRTAAAYMISGVLAAAAGIIIASRVRNLDPTAGAGYEFAALTAVVLGGARLTGGSASVLRTLAGVMILGVIANAMRLNDLSYSLQQLLQGLVLAAAVAVDARLRSGERH